MSTTINLSKLESLDISDFTIKWIADFLSDTHLYINVLNLEMTASLSGEMFLRAFHRELNLGPGLPP